MKNSKIAIIAVLSVVFVAFAAVDTFAQTKRGTRTVRRATPAPTMYRVSAAKKIRVRMNETISSRTARVGDTFTVTVTEPVYSNTGVVVIPTGSEINGRVTRVARAIKGGRPGEIDVAFNRVVLPNGYRRALSGSLTELYADDAKSDNEGTAKGDTMKHRKVIFIGGGGVGGAVLGGALGGPKGAVIGGLLGAGAGLLGERYTKGEEAEVRSGTEFGIYLNQPISMPRYREAE